MDIKNAQEVAFNQLDGKKIMRDIFENESEKERASKIADQLCLHISIGIGWDIKILRRKRLCASM